VRDRLRDWKEVYLPVAEEEVRRQAGRCMDCGVPFCQQGCPLGNAIPDWNDLVYRRQWQEAHERLGATNNFPEFTGRLCPAPCEPACTLAINGKPVTIEHVEQEIIERAYTEGWVQPRPPRSRTGRRVAVVGSGPAGLAAAAQLNSVGHLVTVFERDDRLGGMLRYGIPDFKMEKWVLDRRLELLRAEGIEFRTGVRVGQDVGWRDLREQHDALLVCVGAQKHRDLEVPGRDLAGICFAMDYLRQQNRVVAGDVIDPALRLDAAGKRVVILGGGDTGSDCLGTALRQGAREVRQAQLWPAPPAGRSAHNPWPQWPHVFRISSSQEEGGQRDWAMMTRQLHGDGGRLGRLEAVRIEIQQGTAGKRPVPIAGSEFTLPVDLLILAIGFAGPEIEEAVTDLGIAIDRRGNVAVDSRYQTSVPGVFAAGDSMRGASLIVWAIADGREAAHHVDAYLRHGEDAWLPTRGADCAFG
jgi:glutamate synthase (NADPH/NADH) small chain